MFVVDTNVLVYAANRRAPEHARCESLLTDWRGQLTPWFLTWGIVYEFLRVATHPQIYPTPLSIDEAWGFARGILTAQSAGVLVETERHGEVLVDVYGSVPLLTGNILHDAHTAVLMREHGVRTIVTRDTGFHRFPFLEVIDPLA